MKWFLLILILILPLSNISAQIAGELSDIKSPHPMTVVGNELFVVDENYKVYVYSIEPFQL
ncbi:hypothetical protein ACFL6O_05580, partial [candidate division KSB1 bacterium]